jgi:hypothetical protein
MSAIMGGARAVLKFLCVVISCDNLGRFEEELLVSPQEFDYFWCGHFLNGRLGILGVREPEMANQPLHNETVKSVDDRKRMPREYDDLNILPKKIPQVTCTLLPASLNLDPAN